MIPTVVGVDVIEMALCVDAWYCCTRAAGCPLKWVNLCKARELYFLTKPFSMALLVLFFLEYEQVI